MKQFAVTTSWNPNRTKMAFSVGWVEGDRRRHVWVGQDGEPGEVIYCNPVEMPRHSGLMTRKLNAGAGTHAATMAALKDAMPGLVEQAKAMHAVDVEQKAREDYKRACDLFVDRVNALSPVAAAWVMRRLDAGRTLDELKNEIRNRLEGIDQ